MIPTGLEVRERGMVRKGWDVIVIGMVPKELHVIE
jgi:hypothetical protein